VRLACGMFREMGFASFTGNEGHLLMGWCVLMIRTDQESWLWDFSWQSPWFQPADWTLSWVIQACGCSNDCPQSSFPFPAWAVLSSQRFFHGSSPR
jgi:hypothetical protein